MNALKNAERRGARSAAAFVSTHNAVSSAGRRRVNTAAPEARQAAYSTRFTCEREDFPPQNAGQTRQRSRPKLKCRPLGRDLGRQHQRPFSEASWRQSCSGVKLNAKKITTQTWSRFTARLHVPVLLECSLLCAASKPSTKRARRACACETLLKGYYIVSCRESVMENLKQAASTTERHHKTVQR